MPLREDFDQRLAIAEAADMSPGSPLRRGTEYARSCFGTALYLTGLADEDEYVGLDGNNRLEGFGDIDRFPLLDQPEVGCLVIAKLRENKKKFQDAELFHMAVVTSTEPLQVTQRDGCDGEMQKNVDWNWGDWGDDWIVEFRSPVLYKDNKAITSSSLAPPPSTQSLHALRDTHVPCLLPRDCDYPIDPPQYYQQQSSQ